MLADLTPSFAELARLEVLVAAGRSVREIGASLGLGRRLTSVWCRIVRRVLSTRPTSARVRESVATLAPALPVDARRAAEALRRLAIVGAVLNELEGERAMLAPDRRAQLASLARDELALYAAIRAPACVGARTELARAWSAAGPRKTLPAACRGAAVNQERRRRP